MTSYFCIKCKKRHDNLLDAEKCCKVSQQCLKCVAKNFCTSKDPKSPAWTPDASARYAQATIAARGCKNG